MLQWAVLGGASLALSFGTRVAVAHRTHVSLTRVTPNPRSGRWEIIHAVHYHDALKLLAARGVSDDTQPASVAGRARVALEVERGFLWRAGDGSSLQLFTVGAELEGDNVLVYQELQPPPKPTKIRVESNFLQIAQSQEIECVVDGASCHLDSLGIVVLATLERHAVAATTAHVLGRTDPVTRIEQTGIVELLALAPSSRDARLVDLHPARHETLRAERARKAPLDALRIGTSHHHERHRGGGKGMQVEQHVVLAQEPAQHVAHSVLEIRRDFFRPQIAVQV
ncbi:MAG: hypothetical protein EBU76_07485, partial [Gammaproteobacteria bacterium]|nr:hypothetical protein [Gammaproteobacteria bacterium]